MHRKANRHPAVFGSERQFRLTGQDLYLIFGRKVARPVLGIDKELPHHFRRRVYVNVVERVDRRGLWVKWERPNYMVIHFLFPLPLSISDSVYRSFCRPGKSVVQKLTDELKGLGRSCQASQASQISVDHPFPYTQSSIPSSRDRTLDEADGIIKQYLVVADMHTDRNQVLQIGEKRRGLWLCRIITVQIRTHQLGGLRLGEVWIGKSACRPTLSGESEIGHRRERHSTGQRFTA